MRQTALEYGAASWHDGVVFPKTPITTGTAPWLHRVPHRHRARRPRARQQARRAESLSGSIRQFLTPEVWKQARQAAHAAGCRNDPRWSLQPLILTWAMMTWCAGQTDAERFLTARTFYVRVHSPKRKRLESTSAGSTRPCAACP